MSDVIRRFGSLEDFEEGDVEIINDRGPSWSALDRSPRHLTRNACGRGCAAASGRLRRQRRTRLRGRQGRFWGLLATASLILGATPVGAKGPVSDAEVAARVDALLARMTPAEKAGQITQEFDFSTMPNGVKPDAAIAAGRVGSLLFLTDPAEINRLQKIAVEQSRLKIPLLFGFDVIHGLRTIFPVPIGMAASWDPKMVQSVQTIAAAEARSVGVHWAFAPMVDIARDPRWGRIVEGAGEDPYLGAAMARAQVLGFQGPYIGSADHIIAGPKHFAGYGAALGGRDYDQADISDEQLWNVYLPPFKAALDAGAGSIMSAYMALNGVPGAGNRWLLTDVLRKQWGFKGIVVSDAMAVQSLVTHGYAAETTDAGIRALTAGLDMEMSMPGQSAFSTLPASLAAGKIQMAELDRAVRRILEAKVRMGLFDNPYVDEKKAAAMLARPEHRDAARVAAERSAVLLRNEGNLLPLKPSAIKSIAVIGPLADSKLDTLGPWVFDHHVGETVTILDGIRHKVGAGVRVGYAAGVQMPARQNPSIFEAFVPRPPKVAIDEDAEIKRAMALVAASDVAVLVLGEDSLMIGEMASRSSFDLPGRQRELLKAVVATGKPVVLLLMNGRPLTIGAAKPQAVMDIWYPGTQGGNAVANLLFGDAVPGGKLPFTWPASASQVPLVYSYYLSHDLPNAAKRYWDTSNAPTYPFGYGLSYSTFAFSNLKLDKTVVAPGQPLSVSVDVKNTGQRTADEVAQLYIHQRFGTSSRPRRELKGFERLTLKPGEVRTVKFILSAADRTYWSAATRSWTADEAPFDLWVGDSSEATLSTSFSVRK
ncbi:beta-glucosidase BglX [Sphingomonas mali]|uniref:beta-glucosidase BglX n=1 Tax=Sphingomonas mali TaxID=40682 RepID=UPI0009FF6007|nr:beta-glucosidase BglX [Sphingomonas mali]